MLVKQKQTIPNVTIFIGGKNHSQMGGLWHCFNHITPVMYFPSQPYAPDTAATAEATPVT
jgi:hypothetical protein